MVEDKILVLAPKKETSTFIFQSEKYPQFTCRLTVDYESRKMNIHPYMTDFKHFNAKGHCLQYHVQMEVNRCAVEFGKSELGWEVEDEG